MERKAIIFYAFKILGFFLVILPFSFASYPLDSIDIFSGYFWAPLIEKDNYKAIPLYISLNFSAKDIFKTDNLFVDNLRFSLEPFINTVISPEQGIEAGVDFLFKYEFSNISRVKPYIKGGLGLLYMSVHTYEQSTQYNFLPQIGLGVRYPLNEKFALNIEYRFRHLSNGSLNFPNKGIDASIFLLGVNILF